MAFNVFSMVLTVVVFCIFFSVLHYKVTAFASALINLLCGPPLEGAAYCVALCLSVCLSVCPSVPLLFLYTFFTVEPSYERTSKIEKNFCYRLWASVTYVLFGTHRGPHIVRPSLLLLLLPIQAPTQCRVISRCGCGSCAEELYAVQTSGNKIVQCGEIKTWCVIR